MINARRAVVLATLLVACRKKALPETQVDAAPLAIPSAAVSAPSAAPISSEGPPLRPLPTTTSTSLFEVTAPFSGTYQCFKGMQLVQTGAHVVSTMRANATTETVVACTVTGDVCTGSVRDIEQARGKPPRVLHVKAVTLERSPHGDITFRPTSPTSPADKPTLCRRQ